MICGIADLRIGHRYGDVSTSAVVQSYEMGRPFKSESAQYLFKVVACGLSDRTWIRMCPRSLSQRSVSDTTGLEHPTEAAISRAEIACPLRASIKPMMASRV